MGRAGRGLAEQALAYTAVPCKGARGPLTLVRPRPARHAARNHGDQPGSTPAVAGPLYRLADYLDQHGRAHCACQIPPAEFWSASAAHAAPGEQATLGEAAHSRGLYRDAAQLYKNAAASGNPRAALYLSRPPACLCADPRPAHWAAVHASLDDPRTVAMLLDKLREAGAHEQATALLARDPAAQAAVDDPDDVASLLFELRKAGAHEQATALAHRAAAHASLDDPFAVLSLLGSLREAGAHEQATALADRAAAHAPLDDPLAVAILLFGLRQVGAHEQATALADRAADAPLDNLIAVNSFLGSLRRAVAQEQAAALADPAASHAPLVSLADLPMLLDKPREASTNEQGAALAGRLSLADQFELFLEEQRPADQFGFGREADGAPAAPWGWEDLDLWLVPTRRDKRHNSGGSLREAECRLLGSLARRARTPAAWNQLQALKHLCAGCRTGGQSAGCCGRRCLQRPAARCSRRMPRGVSKKALSRLRPVLRPVLQQDIALDFFDSDLTERQH